MVPASTIQLAQPLDYCHPRSLKEKTMLDLIGALALSAIIVIDVVVLVGWARISRRARVVAYALAAAWSIAIVAIAAAGGFAPGALGSIPVPVLPFALLVLGGLTGWFAWPAFRRALQSVPLGAL